MQQLLKVRWLYGIREFIGFDEDDFNPEMTTTELWTDPQRTEVSYNVDALFRRRGKFRKLELVYKRGDQKDAKVKNQPPGMVRYGVSVISWTAGSNLGNAYWEDDDNSSWTRGVKVDVMGGQRLALPGKTKKSVLVLPRPRQAAFRAALLQLDKVCVLTGESCPDALEAAHVIPSARNGKEQIENGILLRADLHLLFDAGLIWFELADNHAILGCSDKLTHEYGQLRGKELKQETLKRVKDALRWRLKQPYGSGKL